MHAHAYQDEATVDDREGLLDALSTIRDEVTSLKTAMRGMLRENLRLKQELAASEPEPEPAHEDGVAELHRVRSEVDELVRRYDAVNTRRPARAPRSRHEMAAPPRHEVAAPPRNDRLRTMMMMMMMMSELL